MGSQAASANRPGTTWLILLGLVVVLVGGVQLSSGGFYASLGKLPGAVAAWSVP